MTSSSCCSSKIIMCYMLCRCDANWTGDRCDAPAIRDLELMHGELCQLHCIPLDSEKYQD